MIYRYVCSCHAILLYAPLLTFIILCCKLFFSQNLSTALTRTRKEAFRSHIDRIQNLLRGLIREDIFSSVSPTVTVSETYLYSITISMANVKIYSLSLVSPDIYFEDTPCYFHSNVIPKKISSIRTGIFTSSSHGLIVVYPSYPHNLRFFIGILI